MHPAKAERLRKAAHPEAFCKNPTCLWRRSSGACPKHEKESLVSQLEASIDMVKSIREKGDKPWKASSAPLTDISNLPRYSTDISAAWEVVEHFTKNGCVLVLSGTNTLWSASIEGFYVEADTAPLSICLAALRVIGGQP